MSGAGKVEPRTRGAKRVNPVTGKLEDVVVKPGMHRDGCLQLSDKYINAARDAGLGAGTNMYSHVKSLQKRGVDDVPSSTSMAREGQRPASLRENKPTATRGATKSTNAPKGRVRMGVQGNSRTVSVNGSKAPGDPGVHFNRMKGVVNTVGGSKAVNRQPEAKLPPKNQRTGPRIMSFDKLPAKGSTVSSRAKHGASAAPAPAPAPAKSSSAKVQRAPPTIRKLGGSATPSGAAPAQSAAQVREARAAFFAKKFEKKEE